LSHSASSQDSDSPSGLALAIFTYFLWGFLPIYMKLLSHIPAAEVVAHRIIWSVPIAGAILIAIGRTKELRTALTTPKMLGMACLTAGLVSLNWGIYVWTIVSGNALEAALGYYINPLFSVFLGAVLLGERLAKLQWAAIGLAFVAVMILTIDAGRLPLAAIGLTVSWGFYAFFKKSLPIGANQGFTLEVLILSIPSLAYWGYLTTTGESHFKTDLWLLLGCGVVTAIPLMMYANAAKKLRLTTIGILQYIAPTIIFLVAVFLFGEPFGQARLIAFPIIWAALILYSISLIQQRK
jgi:chloramphenicol-sensitive protein RarD